MNAGTCLELAPGVDVIGTCFAGRPLWLSLFRGRDVFLIDSGVAGTPAESILPAMASRGLKARDLSMVVVTHAHADHFGGNAELKSASENLTRFASHRLDSEWIADPQTFTREANLRYVKMGLLGESEYENGLRASGTGTPVDRLLDGGEAFDLGAGLELQIISMPGHTLGNICVLDTKHRILIQGESAAGVGQYDTYGRLITAPFYQDAGTYLATVAIMAGLDFDVMVSSHLPVMSRSEAQAFFEASVRFPLRFEREITRRLRHSSKPKNALELWRSMANLWGRYPADLGLYMLLETHLNGLLARGSAEGSLEKGVYWTGRDARELDEQADRAFKAIRATSRGLTRSRSKSKS